MNLKKSLVIYSIFCIIIASLFLLSIIFCKECFIKRTFFPSIKNNVNSQNFLTYNWDGQYMVLTDRSLGLLFKFPEGWSLQTYSTPQSVALLNAEAVANPTDSDLLRGMKFQISGLSGYADATLEQIEKRIENEGDHVVSQKTLTLDGVSALMTTISNFSTSYSIVLRIQSRVTHISAMVGLQNTNTNANLESEFMKIIESLKLIK
jgi:hypothetical protein